MGAGAIVTQPSLEGACDAPCPDIRRRCDHPANAGGNAAYVVMSTDTVTCTGGPKPARIVTFGRRDFHQILKAKFGLADR